MKDEDVNVDSETCDDTAYGRTAVVEYINIVGTIPSSSSTSKVSPSPCSKDSVPCDMEQARLLQIFNGEGRPKPGVWRGVVSTGSFLMTAARPVAFQISGGNVGYCDFDAVFEGE